jgi:hypothetical protein
MIDPKRCCVRTVLTAALLALAGTGPAQAGGTQGDVRQTKTGCTSAKPYAKFEEVYAEEGRPEAYKVLVRSTRCQILEQPTQVRLEEAVREFDFGWGRGTIWRVSPVSGVSEVPETLYIRIRDGE